MKLKQDTLNIILLCLTFYEPVIVPHNLFLTFKYLVILWVLCKYFHSFKRQKILLTAVSAYGVITVLSSVVNGMPFNTVVASAFFGLQILAIFLATEVYIRKHTIVRYLYLLMRIFLCMILVMDALMLVVNYNFASPSENYLFGNKFVVSYLHCFATAMVFAWAGDTRIRLGFGKFKIKGTSRKVFAYLMGVLSFLICTVVTCSTGMVISAAMILMMLIPRDIVSRLASGKIIIIGMAVVTVLMFGSYSLLTNAYVQSFVQDVLGKSGNFTGRMQIWAIIFDQIMKQPFLGYGYYNGVVNAMLGYGNPQNGILKSLLDTGVIGLIAYGWIVLQSFKTRILMYPERLNPVIAFFYAMLIASLVEINLTHMVVFLTMAIVAVVNKEERF